MKVNSIFAIVSCFIALLFASCDDDLNTIGGTIQPRPDDISISTDTLPILAKTIQMDSVYARTMNGVLGKYEDDVFGTIKSDYLCQYYFPEGGKFQDNLLQIDSAQFVIDFNTYSGDSLAPMGLSVYEATQTIPANFYTNVDPTKYIGSNPKPLASEAYTISGAKRLPSSSSTQREIIADLGTAFGNRIYNGWKNKTFTDNKTFNDFFKGTYVTTNFGSGSLIRVLYTSIDIYYKYNDILGNFNNTADTIRSARFSLTVTSEVMQLNQIKNRNPETLFADKTATYFKTPAGVCTEVVFPIKTIKAHMIEKERKSINTALFTLKGYTEKESTAKYELGKPTDLLLINKDSVESFFSQRKLYDNKTTIIGSRGSNNIYNFANISALINVYKDMNLATDPVFVIIPVQLAYKQDASGTKYLTNVFNYLQPATSIIRNNEKDMRLELVYSKF